MDMLVGHPMDSLDNSPQISFDTATMNLQKLEMQMQRRLNEIDLSED